MMMMMMHRRRWTMVTTALGSEGAILIGVADDWGRVEEAMDPRRIIILPLEFDSAPRHILTGKVCVE